MSQFVVNLSEPEEEPAKQPRETRGSGPTAPAPAAKQKKRGCGRFLGIAGILLLLALAALGVTGYFYWQSVKAAPEYSLALLVDASRRNDQKAVDELVDTDACVDAFLPQIIDKAVELYGRGFPADKIARVKNLGAQFVPAIKARAKVEVPRVIQEKTDRFKSVPYWAIALGAPRFLDIKTNGDTAVVTSRIPDRPFELTMKRNGDKWRIVGIKDELLARRIAEKVGQELIAISAKGALEKLKENATGETFDAIKKKLEDLFK